MKLEFEDLDIFGTPEETRVVYMKLKEAGDQYELLKDINGIIIEGMIDHKVVARKDLVHTKFNKDKMRYEASQLHLTLMNASFALKDLLKNSGVRNFNST